MLDNGLPSVVMGDMNFSCNVDNEGYKQCYVLSRYNVFHCDEFIDGGTGNCVTYYNHSLHHSSFLDHVFVSNTIRKDILYAEVHESGVNLSDHIPVIYTFCWLLKPQGCITKVQKKVKQYSWRWDKSYVGYYYQCSDQKLRAVDIPRICNCDLDCTNDHHLNSINMYYDNIVAALHSAASSAIQRIPCCSLKPFWNEELDRLKQDSIFWHNLWVDAGRPSSGVLQNLRLACKAKYKLAIRNAYVSFEDKLSDELYSHFVNKRIPEFWKSWNAKFRRNVINLLTSMVILMMQTLLMNLLYILTKFFVMMMIRWLIMISHISVLNVLEITCNLAMSVWTRLLLNVLINV